MKRSHRDIAFLATESALIATCGAVTLLVGIPLLLSETIGLTWYDLYLAFLFSVGFVMLSGFVFSLVISHYLYTRKLPWPRRPVIASGLFVVHVAIFGVFFGGGHLERNGFVLVLIGVIAVAVASAVASFLWRAQPS